ncbi:hypothetical protein G3I76_13785 [Streptomyces sp. SID11233]|nr:hypothetical protein [Streptomyces sp. SID11233]
MDEPGTYLWEPRCPAEAELRALRDSVFWQRPELEEGARQEWEALLRSADLDAEQFIDGFNEVVGEYEAARRVLELFREAQEGGLRGTHTEPDPDPRPGRVTDPVGSAPVADGPVPDGTTAEPGPDADRFLNLAIVWPLSRKTVPADRVLAAGRSYELRVDIGALSAESLLAERPRPFPGDLLDHTDDDGRGDWLEATVLGDDFAVPVRRHGIFLPQTGSSWVCPCPPHAPHACEPVHRGAHLYIPFTTLGEPGPARLHLLVSYRGNQVQSAALTALVGAAESRGGDTVATVDYTLTAGFAQLATLPARTAAVRVGRPDGGAMTIDVIGQNGPVSSFWLTEHQVRGALKDVRGALFGVHAVNREDGSLENLIDENNGKPAGDLRRDLAALAHKGADLFLLLARSKPEREALRQALKAPSEIQICQEELGHLTFPWSLLYDIPLDTGVRPAPCDAGWAEIERRDAARSCPAESGHGRNTLCPFGFWGYRHFIEQPPSAAPGRRLRLWAGREGEAPALTLARSLTVDAPLMDHHVAQLRRHFVLGGVRECDRKEVLRQALVDAAGACVYFYAHGRRPDPLTDAPATTVLEIGQGERVTPRDLASWADTSPDPDRDEVAPLVFLNGCHTLDSDPASWLTFVEAFSAFSAAGVVGTEIMIEQGLANEIGEQFWEQLLLGEAVGPALHKVRMTLLRKGNALGLAYTAYCSAALRLRVAA